MSNSKNKNRPFLLRGMIFIYHSAKYFIKAQGMVVTLATIVGVVLGGVPVYFSYVWEKDQLTAIVCDFQVGGLGNRPGVTIVFENQGNKKVVLSDLALTVSPASGSKIIPKIIDLPNGTKFTSYGVIPSGTALAYDIEDAEIMYHVIPFTKPQTAVLAPGESLVRECEIDKATLDSISEQFTLESKFNLGLIISAINSSGEFYEVRIPIAITNDKTFFQMEFKERLPKKALIIPSLKHSKLLGYSQVSISPTTPLKIDFPKVK